MADDIAAQVLQQFTDLGWTREQAAGLTANLHAESKFKPDASGDSGKAYGIAQFEATYGKPIQG